MTVREKKRGGHERIPSARYDACHGRDEARARLAYPQPRCLRGADQWPGGGRMTSPFSRGFRGRPRSAAAAGRLPPGQYETRDFPVLSAGPTPRISLATWDFMLRGPGGQTARWTWDEFQALPR